MIRAISKAAEPIAALVRGHSSDLRKRRWLFMFQAYADESITDGAVMVLGAVVATPARWEAFSEAWQERLDHAPWNAFKMSEVWDRGGEESLEHAKWHYFTMRVHVQGAVAVVVPLDALQRAVDYYELPELGNAYNWAFKLILDNTAAMQRRWGINEPIDFIFDDRAEKTFIRQAWQYHMTFMPPEQRELSGREPIFEDDTRVLPLQAADMWAWWCRKKWLEDGRLIDRDFPIPWGSHKDMGSLIFEWSEKEIRHEFSITRAAMEAGGMIRPMT